LPSGQFNIAIEGQAVLRQSGPLFRKQGHLAFQLGVVLDQLGFAPPHSTPFRAPVAVPALLEPAAQITQALPISLQLLAAVADFATHQLEFLACLGQPRRMGLTLPAQHGVRVLDLLPQFSQTAPLVFEMGRELFLLLFQGRAALLEAGFVLPECCLLRHDRGGLDPQGIALLFQRCPSRCGLLGREGSANAHLKLKRANTEHIAVGQGTIRGWDTIVQGTADSWDESQEHTVRPMNQQALNGMDAFDVQANVAAGGAADDSERGGQRPMRSLEAAILDDQFRGHRADGARFRGRSRDRFHPRSPRREDDDSTFIDQARQESLLDRAEMISPLAV
jgi:hypothetical protein